MNRGIEIPMLLLATFALAGCLSLSYEDPSVADRSVAAAAQVADDERRLEDRVAERAAVPTASPEQARSWSDLTRLAREHQRRGEYDEAAQRLEQAALQVEGLPPSHTRRRTVFGLRARFAEQLARRGEIERADLLAEQLFAEARAEPEIGGPALVSLAVSVSNRRERALEDRANGGSVESGPPEASDTAMEDPQAQGARLELLRIALRAAQAGRVDRQRLQIASKVAQDAFRNDLPDVARGAVDQALADLLVLAPNDHLRIATHRILRARIAMAQGDFDTATTDGTRANQLLEEADATSEDRGYAEAILAEALSLAGEADKAIAIAQGARARTEGAEDFDGHAERTILAALARVESRRGHRDRARRYYDEALALPRVDAEYDRELVEELIAERGQLDVDFPPGDG